MAYAPHAALPRHPLSGPVHLSNTRFSSQGLMNLPTCDGRELDPSRPLAAAECQQGGRRLSGQLLCIFLVSVDEITYRGRPGVGVDRTRQDGRETEECFFTPSLIVTLFMINPGPGA